MSGRDRAGISAEPDGGGDAAAPAFDQQPHAFEDARVVVDAEHRSCRSARRPGGSCSAALSRPRLSRRPSVTGRMTEKRVPLPLLRINLELEPQHAGDAVDDRQAEPEALCCLARALLQPGELAGRSMPSLSSGMPMPVSKHLDFGQVAAPPHADQDAAGARVFDRVGDEVLDRGDRSRLRSVSHRQRRRHDGRAPAALRSASGWKSVPICLSRSSRRNTVSAGFIAPASRREMSSTAPRMVSTDSSEDSMFDGGFADLVLAAPSRSAMSSRAAPR